MENVGREHSLYMTDEEMDAAENRETAIIPVENQPPSPPERGLATQDEGELGEPTDEGIIEGEVTDIEEDVSPDASPETTTVASATRGVIRTFKTAIASAVGRHTTKVRARNLFGKEVTKTLHSQDVLELENRAFAQEQLSESKDKWNWGEDDSRLKRWGKGAMRIADRVWRGTLMKNFHEAKEFSHGMKLSATAGIEGAVSSEFNAEIDRLARERIAVERQNRNWFQQAGYNISQSFREVFAMERDLHKKKLEITGELRSQYENDPSNNANPLYHLVNRDITAREEVARNLRENSLEILQQAHRGDKKVESIKLEGEAGEKVDTFLKEKILNRVIDQALAARANGRPVQGIESGLRAELDADLQDYFFSDEFQAWRETLTPEQQKAFENSFTYATDILTQAEEVLIPSVLENADHYQSADRLNFDIELTLGTAQYSANSERKSQGWFSKERASLNDKLWARMRREVSENDDSSFPHRASAIRHGLRRERTLKAIQQITANELTGAAIGLVTFRGASTALRAGMSWLPFVGSGVVAGSIAGVKEWGRQGDLRAQYGYEEAVGLHHPRHENAKRSAEFRALDYHRLELGRRAQQLADITEKLDSGDFDNTHLLQAASYLADSNARINLGDRYGINLLTASKETPEGRGIYAREVRLHNLARAAASAKLNEVLGGNAALMQELGDEIGLAGGEDHSADGIVQALTSHLEANLERGTRVPENLQTLLGNLTVEEAQSIHAKDKAFNKHRWGSSIKRGAITGVFAGVMSAGLGQFTEHHETVTESGVETVQVTEVHHDLPLHSDGLPEGIGQIHDPETGDLLVTMHAHVPDGTHLVPRVTDVPLPNDTTTQELSYDLITDDTHEVLVRGMEFTDDGQLDMTVEVRDALAHNHIEYEATNLTPVGWGTVETTTPTEINWQEWDNTLSYGDFPGNDLDGHFAENLNESFAAHPELATGDATLTPVERVTQINGLRNLMRGMENWVYKQENFRVDQIEGYNRILHAEDTIWTEKTGLQEVISEAQSDTTKILHVPDLLATAEGNRQVADLINEAVRENVEGDPNFTFSDEAHRIAWEMSYWGDEAHIPDAGEVRTLLEYFGEIPSAPEATENAVDITPHDAWFRATEDIVNPVEVATERIYTIDTPAWWAGLTAVGYHRPLEKPTGNIKNVIVPSRERFPKGKGKDKGKRVETEKGKGKSNELELGSTPSRIRPVVTPRTMGTARTQKAEDQKHDDQVVERQVGVRPADENEEPGLVIDEELDSAINALVGELENEEGQDITTAANKSELEKKNSIVGKITLDAYTKFIPKLRAELKEKNAGVRDWDRNHEKAWLSDADILNIADKYNIPIAFMNRNMHGGPHFIVLTKPPKKQDNGNYLVTYYDPKADGIHEEEINLDGFPAEPHTKVYLSNAAVKGEVSNDSPQGEEVISFLTNSGYNLEIPNTQGKEYIHDALTAKTQVGPDALGDGHNCGPLVLLYAAQAAALHDNSFQDDQIKQWEEDYDYQLIKKENLAAK